jgi:phosphonate degradation associated HDIG domain protein
VNEPAPWRALTSPTEVAERIIEVFEREGMARYDEAVTQVEHAVQAAQWAEVAGAGDALVAAALLHDLGHLLSGDHRDPDEFRERDLHHEDIAARFLARWFGPEVTEPIRLHVAAKRYLCAVEPGYHDGLSPASVRSLELQGGPMDADQAVAFAGLDHAMDATDLRRWDDLAKDPDRPPVPMSSYTELLARLASIPA